MHLVIILGVVPDESKDKEYSRTLCTFGDWRFVDSEDSMWLWLLGESWGKWCSMAMLERHGFDS